MLHQLLALGKELVHIYFRLGIYFLAGIVLQPIFTVQKNNKFFFTLLASKTIKEYFDKCELQFLNVERILRKQMRKFLQQKEFK